MMDQKQSYPYTGYIQNIEDAKIRVVRGMSCLSDHGSFGSAPNKMTEAFICTTRDSQDNTDLEDIFRKKVELSEDRINLVLGEINSRQELENDNLGRLYDDLLRLDNWRLERPFADTYLKDKLWLDFNKMELQLRDQIRREKKDMARDIAFPQKDLRNSLLEFKLQDQKSKMFDMGELEEEIARGEMGPNGSYNQSGDIYRKQTLY